MSDIQPSSEKKKPRTLEELTPLEREQKVERQCSRVLMKCSPKERNRILRNLCDRSDQMDIEELLRAKKRAEKLRGELKAEKLDFQVDEDVFK